MAIHERECTDTQRAGEYIFKITARRNSARTTPTSDTHEKSNNMPRSIQKPGSMTEAMIISKYREGTLVHISINRWNSKSVHPRNSPEPRLLRPIRDENMVSDRPNKTEILNRKSAATHPALDRQYSQFSPFGGAGAETVRSRLIVL